MTVGELGDDDQVGAMVAYTEGGDKLNMTYTFKLLGEVNAGAWLRGAIDEFEQRAAPESWASWSLANHDVPRLATRWQANDAALRAYARQPMFVPRRRAGFARSRTDV
jgi:alpha-glucosidase